MIWGQKLNKYILKFSLPRWQARKIFGPGWCLVPAESKRKERSVPSQTGRVSVGTLLSCGLCSFFMQIHSWKIPIRATGETCKFQTTSSTQKNPRQSRVGSMGSLFLMTILPFSVTLCWTETFWSKNSSLDRATLAVMKHYDPKQVGEKRIYLVYNSVSLCIMRGSQDKSSNRARTWRWSLTRRHGGMLLIDLRPIACLACFVI